MSIFIKVQVSLIQFWTKLKLQSDQIVHRNAKILRRCSNGSKVFEIHDLSQIRREKLSKKVDETIFAR